MPIARDVRLRRRHRLTRTRGMSSTANPIAIAVSNVRGDSLAATYTIGPIDPPTRRAARTPSWERCEPRPRSSPFFVNPWRRTSR